ncbi:hypothetical protein Csa_017791 [Cucumis sativus]|nr:hypothetical protein Csa_017791 [Cucumis sativus]
MKNQAPDELTYPLNKSGGPVSPSVLSILTGDFHERLGEASASFTNVNALQSSVLRFREEMFMVDAGPGTLIICMQDEPTGVPINRADRFVTHSAVGSLDLVAGESLLKKKILERFFIDLVAGESLLKERGSPG